MSARGYSGDGGFEWDDGRGVLPYKFTTTRAYVAAKDLEHMRKFRGPQNDAFSMGLANQIRARTPMRTSAGPGEATGQFHLNAAGRVDSLNVVSATSPAHAQILRSVLAGIHTPSPPGGSYVGSQHLRFH